MEYRHWHVKIWEHGKPKPIETEHHGYLDYQGVVKFFGLNDPDVDRYEITETK